LNTLLCHYSKWFGLPFSKFFLVLSSLFFWKDFTLLWKFPLSKTTSQCFFADAAHAYLLYHNKLPFQLLLFQGLFDFEALLAMGVLSFFTVENLLWWSQLKVLSLGGFPGKTFWLL